MFIFAFPTLSPSYIKNEGKCMQCTHACRFTYANIRLLIDCALHPFIQ